VKFSGCTRDDFSHKKLRKIGKLRIKKFTAFEKSQKKDYVRNDDLSLKIENAKNRDVTDRLLNTKVCE
jgi:hypothetical protein